MMARGILGLLTSGVGLYREVRRFRRDVRQAVNDNHDAARGSRQPKRSAKRQAKRHQARSSNIRGRLISTMLIVVGGVLILWAIYGGTLT